MKKKSVLLMVVFIAMSLFLYTPSAKASGVTVIADGNNVADPYAFINNNRTYVGLRAVSEALGADVNWDPSTQTVTLQKDAKTVKVVIGSTVLTVDGAAKQVDTPAIIYQNRTMVPVRFIAEAFSAEVRWDANTSTVSIYVNTTAPANAVEPEPTQVSVLTAEQLNRLLSYPEVKGPKYLSNYEYKEKLPEEFNLLANAAKDYVNTLGTYNYTDLQDAQKREAYKDFYLRYSIAPNKDVPIINRYIDDIIKNKRVKSTRFLFDDSTVYKNSAYNAASIRGIEEFTMITGSPEDAGTVTGQKYQRDIEIILVNGLTNYLTYPKPTLLLINNLSEPMPVDR